MTQKPQENKTAISAVAEYNATEAALSALKAKLQGTKYEVTTTAGMTAAKQDRRELVTLRVDLEKKRVEIKAPALERCRLIDAEAKRITAELLLLEKPIDEQIKAEEARKEEIAAEKRRLEEQRVAGIRERIQKLNNLPLLAAGMNSADLELFIARVRAQQIGADFAEFESEAEQAKCEVLAKLEDALTATQAAEEEAARIKKEQEVEAARLAAEREELEQLREAERKRQEEAAKIEAEKEAALEAEREQLRKEQEELARKEREIREKEEAERAERERIAREKTEKEAEEKRQAELKKAQEEHEAKLTKATETHKATLESILAAAEDDSLSAPAALQHIIILAKRGLGRKA